MKNEAITRVECKSLNLLGCDFQNTSTPWSHNHKFVHTWSSSKYFNLHSGSHPLTTSYNYRYIITSRIPQSSLDKTINSNQPSPSKVVNEHSVEQVRASQQLHKREQERLRQGYQEGSSRPTPDNGLQESVLCQSVAGRLPFFPPVSTYHTHMPL